MSLKDRLTNQVRPIKIEPSETETKYYQTSEISEGIDSLGEIDSLLIDDEINSIYVHGAKNVFVERKGKKGRISLSYRDNVRLENIIKKNESEIKNLKLNNKKLSEQKNKLISENKNFKEFILNAIKSKSILLKTQLNLIKENYLNEIQKMENTNKILIDEFITSFSNTYLLNQKNNSDIEKLNNELLIKNKTLLNDINIKEESINSLKKNINTMKKYEKIMKEQIDNLQNKLNDEINNKTNLKKENELAKKDMLNFQENLEKLKNVYENKINILNLQNEEKEKNINDKEIKIKELNNVINEEKNQNINLNNKIDVLNQQNINYKKNMEKIIQNKEIKIKQLQQIVNQSFNSLNHGMDNIQLAKKLDNEVQQLIQNVKKNHQNDI